MLIRGLVLLFAIWGLSELVPVWFIFALPGFLCGLIVCREWKEAFFSGFLAVFLLWGIRMSVLYKLNGDLLADRITQMLSLPNSPVLILVIALMGGILSGLSTLSGYHIHQALFKKS